MSTFSCQACGNVVERLASAQRYCETCAIQLRGYNPRRKILSREAGLRANAKNKRSISWYDESIPGLAWTLRVLVPFSYSASKNYRHALGRGRRFYTPRQAKQKRVEITTAIREGLGHQKVAHNKLWIDLLVQKPDHRGDAINVIDVVCDAIEAAVGINDRWFCIRRLDWEIAKEDPQLMIGIGQETTDDAQVCSYCGQIKPLSAFNKDRSQALGVTHDCRECQRVGRVMRQLRADRQSLVDQSV